MDYDRVAPFYDLLALIYSAGGIGRAKKAHLSSIKSHSSVLYAGAGTGAECIEAARAGAKVTVADLSPAMLERSRVRFAKADQTAVFALDNVLAPSTTELLRSFDQVVAPFFLNVIAEDALTAALDALLRRVRPGGQLISVDFSSKSSSTLFASIQQLYYFPPLLLFHLLTDNPWHSLYDYVAVLQREHRSLELKERIVTRAWGLPLFETLIWKRH